MQHESMTRKLWLIATKLHGIAALIIHGDILTSDCDKSDAGYGLGLIIAGLADELLAIHAAIDTDPLPEE